MIRFRSLLQRRHRLITPLRTRALRIIGIASEWCRRQPDAEAAIVGGRPKPLALAAVHTIRARFGPVETPTGFPQLSDGRSRSLVGDVPIAPGPVRRLRRAEVVWVDADTWADRSSDAALESLGRAGVPLAVRDAAPTRAPDSALRRAIAAPMSIEPSAAVARELRSVAIRREAWRDAVDLSERSLSVLLATMRSEFVLDAVDMIAAQDFPSVQLVIGLHGDGFDASLDDAIRERCPGDVVIRRLSDDRPLGDVLHALADASDGSIVTKWDDDDWYGVDHLTDLVLALEYGGADLVGKAAEFVHLEGLGVTIRRFALGAERPSRTLAGGTLALSRDALHDAGGWQRDAPRGVDQLLIRAVHAAGGTTYRTHGFQYVLRRTATSGAGHTWGAGDDYFVGAAAEQWPGLALHAADIAAVGPTGAAP